MNESNSIKAIDKTNVSKQTKFLQSKVKQSKLKITFIKTLIKENHVVQN